jgi:membrane protease YdiL (CAAX protease family)
LQGRWNALLTSIFVGVMWAAWHLPLHFIPRDEAYYNNPNWGIFVSLILVSIIITWIFNNAGGSIFAAMLAHASYNWSNYLFPTLFNDLGAQLYFILLIVLAAAIVLFFGPKKMVREVKERRDIQGNE